MRLALKVIAAVLVLAFFITSSWAETEIEKLIADAKQGDIDAQYVLGEMYRGDFKSMADKSSVEKDLNEAVRWLTEAAKQGHLYAKTKLGEIYLMDDFANRNEEVAARWLADVANSNDPDKYLLAKARYQLGLVLYQECTGYLIHMSGCGRDKTSPPQNYQAAARWFELAAKEGHTNAQFELATMYEHGRGVPQDFEQAAKLYQAAAEGVHQQADFMLGQLYVRMDDLVSAHMWFNLAAADQRSQAAEKRDEIAKRMSPAQIAQAQKLARDYRAAAARAEQAKREKGFRSLADDILDAIVRSEAQPRRAPER